MLVEHRPMTEMEIAPGLPRTHTAPTMSARTLQQQTTPSPLFQTQSHSSQYSAYSQSSALSGSTLTSSSSQPFPRSTATPTPQQQQAGQPSTNGGPITATNNIINQVADASKSLYQICVSLRRRLRQVPGFENHLDEIERQTADGTVDPVTAMWGCFRKGFPLMTVYNALRPAKPIQVDAKLPEAKQAKSAAFKFVQACMTELKFPSDECFQIRDLDGDDTAGFVKVTKVVNRVLDILQERNLLYAPEYDDADGDATTGEPQKRTHRDHVIAELVSTERKYVQDLESLQQFKSLVQEKGVISGDVIHDIFLNLDSLLDFQRRFLIRIETVNSMPPSLQNWGLLFVQNQEAFQVYQPYIANQKRCEETAMREFDRLATVGSGVTHDRTTLSAFLLKPFQRLTKYPMFLKDLRDKSGASESEKSDISAGLDVATSVLEKTNETVDQEARDLAVEELATHVESWKSHKMDRFGQLLLFGDFTVVKHDGKNDVEKEVRIRFRTSQRASARKAKLKQPALELSRYSLKRNYVYGQPSREWIIFGFDGLADPFTTPEKPRFNNVQSTSTSPREVYETYVEDARQSLPAPNASAFLPRRNMTSPSRQHSRPERNLAILTGGRLKMAETTRPNPLGLNNPPKSPGSPSKLRRKRTFERVIGLLSPSKSPKASPCDPGCSPPPVDTTRSRDTSWKTGSGLGLCRFPTTPTYKAKMETCPGFLWIASLASSMGTNLTHVKRRSISFATVIEKGRSSGAVLDDDRDLCVPFNRMLKAETNFFGPLLGSQSYRPHNSDESHADQIVKYKIYLFEKILLCVKDLNLKSKSKTMGMTKSNEKKNKPRLALKGRIYICNVTDTLYLSKPSDRTYTIQIFWTADSGIENFAIRYSNEETMKKWYKILEQQVKGNQNQGHIPGATFRPGNTSDTEFAWVNQSAVPARNPFQEEGDEEDPEHPKLGQSEFNMSRNASSTSLRSRSATGDSGPPMQGLVRAAAPRFGPGFQQPPLSLHTQVSNSQQQSTVSPVERVGQSYFSPTVESPMSSRTSGSSAGMYPFPRQATPQNGWNEEHNRFTAPAMGRTASREGVMMNAYSSMNARNAQRPSLPPMAHQTPQHAALNQMRMRSASSPDIQNQLNGRRPSLSGQNNQPPIPDVPVPPFPAHIAQMKTPINRSQNNSPTGQTMSLPVRAATQSPGAQREKLAQHDLYHGRIDSRSQNSTPLSMVTDKRHANGTLVPNSEPPSPTQLKVKVSFDKNYITLVAGMNITYQILVDRIDAKLGRLQDASIAGGSLRLRYRDEDGDFVTIRSDEDIHIAFSDWKEQQKTQLQHGQVGEIQLYCQAV